jgi:long-chain acyl-CoA synthetase
MTSPATVTHLTIIAGAKGTRLAGVLGDQPKVLVSVGGKTVYRPGRFDPEDVLRLIQEEAVTTWSALGNTGQRVATHPALHEYDLSSIQNIGFGGAPTSPALQQRLARAFPNAAGKLGMGYGLSESGGMGAGIGGDELLRHPTSTGRATPGSQIEIRNSNLFQQGP